MKVRKLAALLLACVLLLTAFSGCTGGEKGGGTSSKTEPNAVSQSSASEPDDTQIDLSEHKKIVMWMVASKPNDMDKILGLLNEKLEKDFNVTLEYNLLGFDSEMATKYRLLLAGGEQVDIIQGSSNFFSSYAPTGAYRELEEALPVYAPDIWEKQSEDAWEQASYDGHIYAIPTLRKQYNPYGIFYRSDLAEKYQCEPVTDFETLEAYLDAISQNEEMLPFNIAGDEVSYVLRMLRAYCGFDIVNENQSVAYTKADQQDITEVFSLADTEEFKEFCTMMKRWNDKGFWSKSVLSNTVWSRTSMKENMSGAALDLLGDIEGTAYFNYLAGLPEGADVQYFDFPSYTKTFHYQPVMGDACAFPVNGDDLGRALMVYNALVTDEDYYMLSQYGVRGVNYEITEEGYYTLPEGVTDDTNGYTEGASGLWPLRNGEFTLRKERFWQHSIDLCDSLEQMVTVDKLAAFVLDTSEIQTEIAAVEDVNTQYLYPLLYGMVDDVEEGIAAYQAELERAGGAKIVESVRQQISEYAQAHNY